MKSVIWGMFFVVLGLSGRVQADNDGNVLVSSLWDRLDIAVCWENPEAMSSAAKTVVKDAIADSWEAVSLVRFTGWGACGANDDGIRIYVDDSNPRVTSIGKHLDGKVNGMYLNNFYEEWGQSCAFRKDYCNAVIAVHEFGHALGFAHEQNRNDTPDSCLDSPQGTHGDIYVDQWDLDSVMNYCNPSWNNYGVLSDTDKEMAAIFYGSPLDQGLAEEIEICDVSATSHDGNVPANVLDGDLSTRWSANGSGEMITFDLCGQHAVGSADLSWYNGDTRSTSFYIEFLRSNLWWSTSVDGQNGVATSSGDTAGFQNHTLGGQDATAIRITGLGNTSNSWNSLNEAKFYTVGGSIGRDLAELNTASSISSEAGENSITLEWTDTSVGEEGYLIEASIVGGEFMNIALLDADASQFVHSDLTESGTYLYRVSAYDGLLRSVPASISAEYTAPIGFELLAPSHVDIEVQGSSAILTWADNSTGESAYYISYKSTDDTEFGAAYWLAPNTETYTITDLAEGSYDIRVWAYGEGQSSAFLNLGVTISAEVVVSEITPVFYEATSDDGNTADNLFDEDYGTRWSALGDGENVTIDLGAQYLISEMRAAWYKGDERQTRYQVAISDDASAWVQINDSISSGESLSLEHIINGDYSARYVRIIGLGNTSNDWNSITEVKIFGSEL